MLMNERVAIGAGGGGGPRGAPPASTSFVKLARQRGLDQDPVVRNRLADLYIKRTVLGYIGMQIREAFKAGRDPGPDRLDRQAVRRRCSPASPPTSASTSPARRRWRGQPTTARPTAGRWPSLQAPASAIAGGTNEIQRNIIGERVLGLPKEPQVDRDQPFKELTVGTQR